MLKRVAGAGVAGAVAVAAGWAGFAAWTWQRYGNVPREGSDELLDRLMPAYEVREVHETTVQAPAAHTYEAAMGLDFARSPLVRAIFRAREVLMRGHPPPRQPRPFLEEVRAIGWRALGEVPCRRLVFGAATRPWEADVRFRGLPAEEFAAFAEPGYAKIIWTVGVEDLADGSSVFRTETRVATTDADSRARFRRYWSVFSPGIRLIRYEMLRLVRTEAERRAGMARSAPALPPAPQHHA